MALRAITAGLSRERTSIRANTVHTSASGDRTELGRVHVPDQKRLRLARAIVWSLDAGVMITILLAMFRVVGIAPGVIEILLRPASYLLAGLYGNRIPDRVAFALCDAVIYGLLSFVVMHLWSGRGRLARLGPAREDRRRGFRVGLATPVFVYGWLADEPFSEDTETLNVSEIGGLIPLSAKVVPSQELILTNLQTDTDMPCRVARSMTREDGKTLAALAFLEASPSFWQVEFASKTPRSLVEPHS
jgi:hypothetical protein